MVIELEGSVENGYRGNPVLKLFISLMDGRKNDMKKCPG
jgi:hypothetical protein